MLHYIQFAFWALAAYVSFVLLSSITTRIRNASKARQFGCQTAPKVPAPLWDFWRVTELRGILNAARNGRFPDYLMQRQKKVSKIAGFDARTYESNLLGRRLIITTEPENVKAILATQFKDFNLPPTRRLAFGRLLGNGIFTSDGKIWEHSRALMRPNFAREQVSNLDLEARHNQVLLRALALQQRPENNGWTNHVDLAKLFFRLTLDTSTEFLFGESVNSQQAELPGPRSDLEKSAIDANDVRKDINFADAFDNAQTFVFRRSRLGNRYWLMRSEAFERDCDACHAFIDYYVQLALQQPPMDAEKVAGAGEKGQYVFLRELAQRTRDPIELRNQLLHILLAGRDTTASLLSWLFMLLARHPEVFAKLREAIIDDFGDRSAAASEITFTKLKGCAYLQACLSEALRLYPVVPANSRHSIIDTTLPRGGGPDGTSPVFVPKGTDVAYSVFVMHRDRTFWGDDAHEFKPERFIKRKQGFEFLPFNGGPRVCLGQNFALTSAGYATVKMLQTFDKMEGTPGCETDGTSKEPRCNNSLTMRPFEGTWVRLHEAK